MFRNPDIRVSSQLFDEMAITHRYGCQMARELGLPHPDADRVAQAVLFAVDQVETLRVLYHNGDLSEWRAFLQKFSPDTYSNELEQDWGQIEDLPQVLLMSAIVERMVHELLRESSSSSFNDEIERFPEPIMRHFNLLMKRYFVARLRATDRNAQPSDDLETRAYAEGLRHLMQVKLLVARERQHLRYTGNI